MAVSEEIPGRHEIAGNERQLVFRHGERSVAICQPTGGYGMLTVRTPDAGDIERYYGLSMALDHAAELLGVAPATLVVPEAAEDLGI